MADLDVGSVFGAVDKRRGRGSTEQHAEKANMLDISSMRTRLAAISSTTYTTARLNAMTRNDMVFALREAGAI